MFALGLVCVGLLTLTWAISHYRSRGGAIDPTLDRGSSVERNRSDLRGEEALAEDRELADEPALLTEPEPSTVVEAAVARARISGLVRDKDGVPVPGASVVRFEDRESTYSEKGLIRSTPVTLDRVETGEDGTFSFEVGEAETSTLSASGPGFATVERAGCYAHQHVEIVMLRAATLRGSVVLDEDDSPIADARVRVFHGPDEDTISEVRTDATGRFELAELSPGTAGLQVVPERHAMPYWIELVLTSGVVEETEVRVSKGWVVSGQVRDRRTLEPIQNAEVSGWRFLGKNVKTDAQGLYRLEGLREVPGTLVARAPGYGQGEIHYTRSGEEYDLELVRGFRVTGQVVDEVAQAVAGAQVIARGSEYGVVDRTEWISRVSDAAGLFELPDVRRDLELQLLVRAPGYAERQIALPRPGAESLVDMGTIELTAGASIAGHVKTPEGTPRPGVWLTLVAAENASPPATRPRRETDSSAEGAFRIAGLAAGEWRLTAHTQSGRVETVIALEPGEHLENLEVVLRSGGRITGIVRGPDQRGIPEATVMLLPEKGSSGRRHYEDCDEFGHFEFAEVSDGVFTLYASTGRLEYELEENETWLLPARIPDVVPDHRHMQIELVAADAYVSGVVVNAAGDPEPLALVSRDRGDGRLFDGVLADELGNFRVRVASNSSNTLRAWSTVPLGRIQRAMTVLEHELKRQVVDVKTPGVIIHGVLAGTDGIRLQLQ